MAEVGVSAVYPGEGVLKLKLAGRALRKLERIASRRSPAEACGVLLGRIEGGVALVEEVVELENVLKAWDRFWFDVREWMDAVLRGRERGLEYIGIFHTHPRGRLLPSLSDRQRMLECPGEVWLIVAAGDGGVEMAAWKLDERGLGIVRVEVERVEGAE